MSDSRAEKLASHLGLRGPTAVDAIQAMEAAGLTVVDTTDEATIDRVARALWDGTSERLPMHSAHKVLASLRGDS